MDRAPHVIGCVELKRRVSMTWRAILVLTLGGSMAWRASLATSQDAVELKKRGFKVLFMTWRALSISPYHARRVGVGGGGGRLGQCAGASTRPLFSLTSDVSCNWNTTETGSAYPAYRQRIAHKVLTLSRNVDECKPMSTGPLFRYASHLLSRLCH
jgi:hypothetical protein